MNIDILRKNFCRFGTPKIAHRGTGKVAIFVVAERIRVETWQQGQLLTLDFPTSAVLDVRTGNPPESNVQVAEWPDAGSGTKLTLIGFKQGISPPSTLRQSIRNRSQGSPSS